MLMHVSERFPSHWVLLTELIAVLLLSLVTWRLPRVARWTLVLWRWVERLPHGPRAPWFYAFVGAFGAAMVCLLLGVPIARVTDEQANLLAADTFAHGRLASPTPPFAEHFEQQHVLLRPVRMSKYPPGPALVMALGELVLSRPIAGLWLQAGALAAAIYWLVAGLAPPPWPGLAALLGIARLGVGSYWHQSYWGGGLAAIGGCLALGATVRLADQPKVQHGVWLGFGLVILANSRYYEGLLFAIPCVAIVLWRLLPRRAFGGAREAQSGLRALVPAAIVGAAALVWMLYYNHRVTGHAFALPHLVYTESALPDHGHFLWTDPTTRGHWGKRAIAQLWSRSAFFLELTLGLPLAVVALALSHGLSKGLGVARATAVWSATLVTLLGQSLTVPWFQHYAAPATGGVVVLAIVALRRLRLWRPRGRDLGAVLAAIVLLVSVLSGLLQVRAYRPDDGDWSLRRAAVEDQLESEEGKHLVIVRYLDGSRRSGDWVFNLANLEEAKVLWAHEISRERADRLRAGFSRHRAWLLEVAAGRADRGLMPWPGPPIPVDRVPARDP